MSKKFNYILIATLAISLAFCGKKEEAKTEMKEEAKTTATVENGGDSKIKAYEDFVTKYCALTDKMKTASAVEKVALAKDFKADADNLKTLKADADSVKEMTPAQTAKLQAATSKAAGCTANAAGVSAPSVPSMPSAKDLPKAPKIPGM